MTFVTKVISICLCIAIAATAGLAASIKNHGRVASATDTAAVEEQVDEYPYILVHGMGGWGTSSGLSDIVHYWGGTMGPMVDHLKGQGIEAYEASVGPMSSAWDRACELYAQLTGGRVDYGKAHSEKYGHDRYGRTYETPLVAKWDSVHKINLYGHSFGGPTSRLMTSLLGEGSAAEKAVTPADELSPLFTGGKADYIFSVTTICSPNNGSTLSCAFDNDFTAFVKAMCYVGTALAGNAMPELIDVQLSQFGVAPDPGESEDLTPEGLEQINEATEEFANSEDNVFFDVSLKGADELNKLITIQSGVYYFSFAADGTRKSALTGNSIPTSDMFLAMWGFAYMMGKYTGTTDDGYVIDESWQPNDGIVNTISALAPADEPSVDFDAENIRPGVWNKMPVIHADHGAVVGLLSNFDETAVWFEDNMNRINSLSEKH